MAGRRGDETKWRRLDNTATIFPVISNRNFSSVYRVSVRLNQDIVPELLQKALDSILPWFESFRVRIRHGFFWYYFETNHKRPLVSEEKTSPCMYIDPADNSHFLFKVTYFGKHISLEMFHALSDGNGAINFLKELACAYIRLANRENLPVEIQEVPVVEVTSDTEDSYIKNYRRTARTGFTSEKAFRLKGERLPLFTTGVIHGEMDTRSVLELCRSKNVTVTQYFSSVLIWSMYREFLNEQPCSFPVRVFIPVNLRPFFDSTTTTNFFSSILVGVKFDRIGYTFEDVLESVSRQCREQLTRENFEQKIAYNVSVGKNMFVRFMPLIIKNLVMKIVYLRTNKASSITISNLGRIDVPDSYRKHMERFEVLINVNNREPTKCAVCSFGDKMVLTFTSRHRNTYLQRAFFRKLAADGLDVIIDSNGVYNEKMQQM